MEPGTKNELIRNVIELEDSFKNLQTDGKVFYSFYPIITTLMSNDGYQTIFSPSTYPRYYEFLCIKNNPPERICVSLMRSNQKIESDQVLERISVAYNYPYDRMVIVGVEGFTLESQNLVNRYEPVCIELLDLNDIRNWVSRVEVETELEKLDYEDIIRIVSKTLIEKIVADPAFLKKIEWREFEKMMAELFEGLAFNVKLTPTSKDGGKDLILEMTKSGTSITYIVEIKHWRSMQRVGQNSVKDFINVICKEKIEKGIFLSTFGFTENAFEGLTTLERSQVRFGSQEKIIALSQTYLKVKSGIWTPLQDLQELLFEGTY